MSTRRGISSMGLCSLVLMWASATHVGARSASASVAADVDACSLLTPAEASKALEVSSLPGKRLVAVSPKVCGWTDGPAMGPNYRRVVVTITSLTAFQVGKSGKNPTMTIEPAAGIGDEAYYEILKTSESPFLVVRKGNAAFTVRVLNGLKLKAFTLEQEKSKEADLAKAAAARL